MIYPYSVNADTLNNTVKAGILASEILASSIASGFQHINVTGDAIEVHYQNALSAGNETILDGIVAAHAGPSQIMSLGTYLNETVFPFIKNLLNNLAAENIAMGITQAGKSGDMLGLYDQQFTVSGIAKPVSLKASLDTGSLYVTIAVLQHIRDNPTEYSSLDPFITDARLLSLKNQIETFLGITLST